MARPQALAHNPNVNFMSGISLAVTKPESLVFHWLQTHELERLMRLERPFPLAIASATTGYALGMIPVIQTSAAALSDLSKATHGDLIWAGVYLASMALSVGISITTWIDALRGRSDAKNFLEEIKKRPQSPFPPELP